MIEWHWPYVVLRNNKLTQKNLLIYGGSFDPPHLGHLNIALNVQRHFHFQSFIFLPCKTPVLKQPTMATATSRIDMLKLMLKRHSEFSISTREIDRKSPSYMAETLASYRNELGPSISITLLLGMDAFLNLNRWHAWEKIPGLCNLLIIKRPSELDHKIPNALKSLLLDHQCSNPLVIKNHPYGKIAYFEAGEYFISSTQIREKIQLKIEIHTDLDPVVYDYIRTHRLYQ